MSNDSNIYAHKIFAEHPLGLWALDEDTHYLSIFTDTDRDLSQWSFSDSTGITLSMQDASVQPYPVLGTQVSSILKTSVSSSGSFYVTSTPTFSIDNTSDTVSIGFYYFKTTPYLSSIKIGRKTSGSITYIKTITTSSFQEWQFASATFEGITGSSQFVLEFIYSNPAGDNVGILINGLSAGRWSQEYNREFLGANSEALPAYMEDLIGCTQGVRAQKHGSDSGYGYYIVGSNGKLSARNASMPMVYGAYNSTILVPGVSGEPSVIVPGNGFLLDSEKLKVKTFEAWIRIDSKAIAPRRILGPVSTNDGLYVTGPFLVLRIGTKYASYYVGEWNRPMLIQISTSATSAQVFINGDQCISLSVNMTDETLADLTISGVGNVNDWVGIYAYDDVPVVEVDAIAIYPYQVDTVLAQRRFVLGEAVKFPEQLVTGYSGQSVVPDYSFAKYANNQSYGSNQKSEWGQGTLNNFTSESGILRTPRYSLPQIETSDSSIQADYYNDLTSYLDSVGGEIHFTMKPQISGTKWDSGAHIFFDSISTISNKVDMFYVVGQAIDYSSSTQTIFKIVNKQTGDYIKATLSGTGPGYTSNEINYVFKYGSNAEVILGTTTGISTSDKYIAAVNFRLLASRSNNNISNFLSNESSLKVYVGSQEDFSEVCSSKIFGVGFGDEYNARKVLSEFDADGFFNGTVSAINNHKANYKFVPFQPFSSLDIDPLDKPVIPEISVSSYWKEDVPLSSLAKSTKNADGTSQYSIDYLQINFDYPHPISYSGDNHDTSDSMVKAYVSFEKNSSGYISNLQDLETTHNVPRSYYVPITNDWYVSKYEVVNGTIIGIPQDVSIEELSLVIHIEADTDASLTYPLSIRYFEVSSQVINSLSTTPSTIGTKFGVDLVPFGYNSENINPILMTKRSDPYYYLSDQSGVKIAGQVSTDRGYYIPINEKIQEQFNIGGIQTTMKIEDNSLLSADLRIFSISKDLSNNDLRFYLEAANGDATRARIYAVLFNGTSETAYTDLEYYINGSLANDPVITMNEWFSLGINFTSIYSDTALTTPTIVNFNNDDGRFNFYGPMLINNFSYFQLKKEEEEQRQIISRKWAQVEYTDSTINTWNTWKTSSTWTQILTTNNESDISGLNAKELYGSFVGSNVITMETESSKIEPNCFRYDFHSNFVTTNIILSAL